MKAPRVNALEQALALMRAPALLATLRQRSLPDDMLTVLRLAASDEELLARTAAAAGETREHLVEAAVFYIQQVLFAPGSDSYRVLGVNPDATDARIKENYRWLVKWLHPDRNTDDWDAIYADRVNRAWQDLRSPDRRDGYDRQRILPGNNEDVAPVPGAFPVRHPAILVDEPLLSSRVVRHMPLLVFAGLGATAALILGLLWYVQSVAPPDYVAADDAISVDDPKPAAEPVAATTLPAPAPAPVPVAEPVPAPVAATAIEPAAPVAAAAPDPEFIEREVQRRLAAALAKAERELRAAAPGQVVTRGQSDGSRSARVSRTEPPREAPPEPVATPGIAPAPASQPLPTAAPAVAIQRVPDPAPATEPPLIDEAIAAELLFRFRDAYARGDLERMMALFARSARNNRGDRDAIRKDYRDLFASSDSRQLMLNNTNWLAVGDTATILTSFEAVVVPSGSGKARRVSGDIRFDLRREDGTLRIVRLLHDNASN